MIIETTKLSSRGQLVLPKNVRDAVGASEGDSFTVAVVGSKVVLERLDTERIRKDLETFRELRRKAPKYSDEEIKRIINEVRRRRREEGRA